MSPIELTDESFTQVLQDHDMVVIDFWAPWCGPCRTFAPIIEQVAETHPGILFAKANTDENRALVDRFNVLSIPMLAVFREGKWLFSRPGLLTEYGLNQIVEKIASLNMDEVRAEMDLLKNQP